LLYVDKETFNEANLGQDLSFRVSSKTRISSTLIGSFKQGTRVAWELIAVYYHEFKVDEKFMKVGSQQRYNKVSFSYDLLKGVYQFVQFTYFHTFNVSLHVPRQFHRENGAE
jgi:hypothetical protein